MSKLHKSIALIILIILVFAQIACINSNKKVNNTKVYNMQNDNYKIMTLKQINEELNGLKGKTILSESEIDGKWVVKVKINGSKYELINEINKLKNYDISDYVVNKNKDENYVILEISAKGSA